MTDSTNGRVTWKAIQMAMGIVIPFLAIAVTWGTLTARIDTLVDRQHEIESQLRAYDATLVEIQVRLAEIQKDILYIREQVDERKDSDAERDQLAGDVGAPGERTWAGDHRLAVGTVAQAVP